MARNQLVKPVNELLFVNSSPVERRVDLMRHLVYRITHPLKDEHVSSKVQARTIENQRLGLNQICKKSGLAGTRNADELIELCTLAKGEAHGDDNGLERIFRHDNASQQGDDNNNDKRRFNALRGVSKGCPPLARTIVTKCAGIL